MKLGKCGPFGKKKDLKKTTKITQGQSKGSRGTGRANSGTGKGELERGGEQRNRVTSLLRDGALPFSLAFISFFFFFFLFSTL